MLFPRNLFFAVVSSFALVAGFAPGQLIDCDTEISDEATEEVDELPRPKAPVISFDFEKTRAHYRYYFRFEHTAYPFAEVLPLLNRIEGQAEAIRAGKTLPVEEGKTDNAGMQLLTREEEETLFLTMNYEKHMARLSVEEGKLEAAKLHMRHAREVAQGIYNANLRMVKYVLRKRFYKSAQIYDIDMVADLQATTAIQYFDCQYGPIFITYLGVVVFRGVAHHIGQQRKNAEKLLLPEIVAEVPQKNQADEPPSYMEILLDVEELRPIIELGIDSLTEVQGDILRRRLGLGAYTSRSIIQVAHDLKTSKQNVQQIEVRALSKLRKFLMKNYPDLRYYLEEPEPEPFPIEHLVKSRRYRPLLEENVAKMKGQMQRTVLCYLHGLLGETKTTLEDVSQLLEKPKHEILMLEQQGLANLKKAMKGIVGVAPPEEAGFLTTQETTTAESEEVTLASPDLPDKVSAEPEMTEDEISAAVVRPIIQENERTGRLVRMIARGAPGRRAALERAINSLDDEFAIKVLQRRYGFGGHGSATCEAIARELGVELWRVTETERKANEKIIEGFKHNQFDYFPDPIVPFEYLLASKGHKKWFSQALEILNEKQREITTRRFGIGRKVQSFAEASEELEISMSTLKWNSEKSKELMSKWLLEKDPELVDKLIVEELQLETTDHSASIPLASYLTSKRFRSYVIKAISELVLSSEREVLNRLYGLDREKQTHRQIEKALRLDCAGTERRAAAKVKAALFENYVKPLLLQPTGS